jgi:hypothetical protein
MEGFHWSENRGDNINSQLVIPDGFHGKIWLKSRTCFHYHLENHPTLVSTLVSQSLLQKLHYTKPTYFGNSGTTK